MASSAASHTASIYEVIGRIFGRERVRKLGFYISAAGLSLTPESAAGLYLFSSIALSFLIFMGVILLAPIRGAIYNFSLWAFFLKPLVLNIPQYFLAVSAGISIVFTFALVCMAGYVALLLLADRRRDKIEQALPDFLTLAAANVRAGMTIDQAMWYAAKPEFGLLSDEVEVVAKQAFGGVPFPQALDGLALHTNSRSVRRMVALIKQGLASGGEIAEILERTSEDTRNMQIIKKDISASLLMYIIFIVFAAGIGTPFLFAVSSKLIGILEHVFAQIPDTSQISVGSSNLIKFSSPAVSSDQFFMFVMASTVLTAIMSSMMIGVIQRGAKREGIKYFPFLIASGLTIFILITTMLEGFIGGIGGV